MAIAAKVTFGLFAWQNPRLLFSHRGSIRRLNSTWIGNNLILSTSVPGISHFKFNPNREGSFPFRLRRYFKELYEYVEEIGGKSV